MRVYEPRADPGGDDISAPVPVPKAPPTILAR